MVILSLLCPHCLTENTAVTLVKSIPHPNDGCRVTTLGYCRSCYRGICIEFTRKPIVSVLPEAMENLSGSYSMVRYYPEVQKTTCPLYCSENLNSYYLQAEDSLVRKNYDAAGMMFRKVLDVATKILGADSSKNLKKRIDDLKSNHKITPDMAEWAHQIRLDGNEAAHEDEPLTKEAAEALKGFTELLLMYAFTLPGMLAARKAAATPSSST